MGISHILHDGFNVCEVEVDESGHVDGLGDALHALAQDVVSHIERVLERDRLVSLKELKSVVGNYDKGVNVLTELCESVFSETHLSSSFEGERLRDYGYSEDALLFRDLGDHGSCSCSGTAAHSCGNEYHVGAFQSGCDLFAALIGCALALLGITAGSQSVSQLVPYLKLVCGFAVLKDLAVGIHRDKFDALDPGIRHAVNCVSAASADTYDFDVSGVLGLII